MEKQSWEASPGFTWILWVFTSAHWYPEVSSVVFLILDGLGIRWETVLLCPVPSLTSGIEESLCFWDSNYPGDHSFARSTMQMKRAKMTFDSLRKWSVCHFFSCDSDTQRKVFIQRWSPPCCCWHGSSMPKKVYFLPLCTASLSTGTAEVRFQSAHLTVSCGAVRGLGDDPRNVRRKSMGIRRENEWPISSYPHSKGGRQVLRMWKFYLASQNKVNYCQQRERMAAQNFNPLFSHILFDVR